MNCSYLNELLDEYNDYMWLYNMFGDTVYFEQAGEALNHLKVIVNRAERYKSMVLKIKSDKLHAFTMH